METQRINIRFGIGIEIAFQIASEIKAKKLVVKLTPLPLADKLNEIIVADPESESLSQSRLDLTNDPDP